MTIGSPPPPSAVRVENLAVSRGGRTLFSGLGFAVAPGGVLLLRGPNGAGKSSLLLALAGLLRPEAGRIDLGGLHEVSPVHYVGHLPAVKARLTLAENLRFWVEVYGGGDDVSGALTEVGLGGLDGHDAGHLSEGQTRRLGLARLVAIPRPIWLLDEPTAALDTGGEAFLMRLIARHRLAGGIVIAAPHHDLALANPDGVETLTLGAA